jgi:hypothetical protein
LATQELGGQHQLACFFSRGGRFDPMVLNARIGCWFPGPRHVGDIPNAFTGQEKSGVLDFGVELRNP